MIPKRELRIGNLIINREGQLNKITKGAEIDDAENFRPIQLNDIVLKKSGFTFHDYFKLWQKTEDLPKSGILLEMDNDYNVRDFSHHYTGVRLTTLHQLQNFLFEFKGIELEWKDAEEASVSEY
jgi:hypothetical protein